jgi:hypothetical protein
MFPAVRETYNPGWFNGFRQVDWIEELTRWARNQIEQAVSSNRIMSLYLYGPSWTRKSTWARMLEPSATWFNRSNMNGTNWIKGDKVIIADNIIADNIIESHEGVVDFWALEDFFGCQDKINWKQEYTEIIEIEGPFFFLFLYIIGVLWSWAGKMVEPLKSL